MLDIVLTSKPTSLMLDIPSNTAFVGTETGTVELWDITGASGASPCCVLPSRDGSHQAVTALCSNENPKTNSRLIVTGDESGAVSVFKSHLFSSR